MKRVDTTLTKICNLIEKKNRMIKFLFIIFHIMHVISLSLGIFT